MRKKFPFVPTFVCLLGVIVLCALGTWQVERLSWKNNLQAALDKEFSEAIPSREFHFTDFDNKKIQRGYIEGKPDMSKAIMLHGRVADGRSLISVIVPLQTRAGDVVALEIACGEKITIEKLRQVAVYQSLRFDGVLRPAPSSYWAPQNSPEKDDWWRVDMAQFAEHWGMPKVQPLLMSAENLVLAGQDVMPCPIEKTLRNDHFSYAIFWFIMAGVLCVMWAIRFLRPYLQSA
jgi:surfeit locus 1 family protein